MRPGFRSVVLLCLLGACNSSHLTTRDAGPIEDAGPVDAGLVDAGSDAGTDAGSDAGSDAGPDAGVDAGSCGFTWHYPLHYPCNSDADCQNGHCAFSLESSTGMAPPGICTERCATQGVNTDCPTNFICDYAVEGTSVSTYCLPTAATDLLPADMSLPFGSPCASNADCQGADGGTLCGLVAEGSVSYSFCSPPCNSSDPTACGGCGTCQQVFTTGGTSCLPKGPGKVGDPCTNRTDCDTFVCADFCTAVCGVQPNVTCPDNADCVDDGQMQSICVSPSQEHSTQTGDMCLFDFQCVQGDKCLADNTGETICTHVSLFGEPCQGAAFCSAGLACTPLNNADAVCTTACPPGCGVGSACVAPELDTVINLFNSPDPFSEVASNDDASGQTKWSSLSYTLSPGTYWVEVTENTAFINGNAIQYTGGYTLSMLDGVNTPIQVTELPQDPTGNQSFGTAQVIPSVPAVITGSFGVASNPWSPLTDYYQFSVSSAVTLTFTTGPGTPSVCVPAARNIGDPCWTNDNCASQLCDATLKTCTQTCTADSDCGSGFHCVAGEAGQICAAASQYESTAAGDKCAFGWQCETGTVCALYGSKQVCAPVCSTSADAGMSSCNPAMNECAAVTSMDQQGSTTATQACVPLGNRMGGFGSTCTLQSDCAQGMTCTAGVCTASCTTTADCPNQHLAPAPGDTSTDVCRPCQNDADCGIGLCLNGKGYERFCGDPCDASGACPAGFNCVQGDTGSACAPAAGSCRAPTCQMSECVIPQASYAEACTKDSDCTTGSCQNNLCTHTCQATADCACPSGDLTCQAGECAWNANYIATQLTATTMTSAQKLTGNGPWTVFATMSPGNGPTAFYYSFPASTAGAVNIVTSPVCAEGSPGLNLALELFDSNNSLVMTAFPFNAFPQISAFNLPAPGTYTVEVLDFGGSTDVPGDYVLNIQAP